MGGVAFENLSAKGAFARVVAEHLAESIAPCRDDPFRREVILTPFAPVTMVGAFTRLSAG